METLLTLALALAALAAAALAWRARRPAPGLDVDHLRAEQARSLAALDRLAAQASEQQRSIAALLEAARASQGGLQALQASVAEQRQQGEGLKAAMAAAAGGLAEVKVAAEAQRAAQGEARAALAQEIAAARQMLERVGAEAKERAARAEEAFASLGRLEAIIAGTKSRGTAGENMLAEVIKQLPPEFRDYDVRVGGKTVEFAIPLPNGRCLPVDSKWTSVDLLDRLATCPPEEAPDLVAQVQADVTAKVAEVEKYLDPEKTCMMAVLAVPDAVYDLCAEAHVAAHRKGVVIVAYSLAVPYVLSVVQVIRRFGARVDEAQLSHAVQSVLAALEEMGEELDGRFARSLTQLDNSRRALRGSIGKAQQAVGRVRVEAAEGPAGHGHAAAPADA